MHEFAIDVNNPCASFKVIPPSTTNSSENTSKSLSDLIDSKIKANKRFFGIEISPAAKGSDLDYRKFASAQPLFTSITWLSDDNLKCESLSEAPAIQLGRTVQKCNPLLMHLTCYKLTQTQLNEILGYGFRNILALKGDSSHSSGNQIWTYAIDLVKTIREIDSDASIGVAGYVEVHHLAQSRADDLRRLKEKVDAGANFIITNVCFSFEHLVEFIRCCRANGITVPIIPGIFVPNTYDALQKMCNICQFNVPSDQSEIFEQHKNDDERFRAYAIENAVHLLTQLFTFDEYPIYGVQFFTLNKYDQILAVVEKCHHFFGLP